MPAVSRAQYDLMARIAAKDPDAMRRAPTISPDQAAEWVRSTPSPHSLPDRSPDTRLAARRRSQSARRRRGR